jgi:hypothetical protein
MEHTSMRTSYCINMLLVVVQYHFMQLRSPLKGYMGEIKQKVQANASSNFFLTLTLSDIANKYRGPVMMLRHHNILTKVRH